MKWPTLAGRLNQPFASTEEAIKQMEANGDILTEYAKRILKKTKKHSPERCNRKRYSIKKFKA